VALYHAGLSLGKAGDLLRSLGCAVSHGSIRRWYLRLGAFMTAIEKGAREALALDETELKARGGEAYVWAAGDVGFREVLAVDVGWSRSILAASLFLKRVSERCASRSLIVVDKGPWYPPALQEHGYPYRHERFGMRNTIESSHGSAF
jgi:transposase-like protein